MKNRILTVSAITIIVIGLFLGVRYVSVVFHYTCADPEEDCPPPFQAAGELGYVLTGGSLNPLWTRD